MTDKRDIVSGCFPYFKLTRFPPIDLNLAIVNYLTKDKSGYICRIAFSEFVVMWPAESFLGYLSVIPGQFCGMRYSSLVKSASSTTESPVDLYLRGMESQSAFETTMFLAEDRVMGFELLTHEGSDNRLEYCQDSTCYTEECTSVKEFLGQRRRWVNSAFVCRTWMIGNIYRYFKGSSSPALTKAHTGLSLLNMLCTHALEWFMPLINVLILAVTYLSINQLVEKYEASEFTGLFAIGLIAAGWVAPVVLAVTGLFQRFPAKTANFILHGVSFIVAIAVGINILASLSIISASTPLPPSLVVLSVFSCCVWLSALLPGTEIRKILSKTFISYLLLANPLYLMTFCYAFLNLDDNSWGTKGLVRKTIKCEEKRNSLPRKLKFFRFSFVSIWLTTNVLLIVLALKLFLQYDLLLVVGIISMFLMITGLFGVIRLTLASLLTRKYAITLSGANDDQ